MLPVVKAAGTGAACRKQVTTGDVGWKPATTDASWWKLAAMEAPCGKRAWHSNFDGC